MVMILRFEFREFVFKFIRLEKIVENYLELGIKIVLLEGDVEVIILVFFKLEREIEVLIFRLFCYFRALGRILFFCSKR